MIFCLDIGNTHIFGGLYLDNTLKLQFRYPSASPLTSDQLGLFFKSVLRENGIDPSQIKKVAICSVIPALHYSIRSAFLKYFSLEPFFLHRDANMVLKIGYDNPHEVGADRISNGIAAIEHYPNQNIIVIDLGTATTFDVITADKIYKGGIIMPGIHISMKALYENTAKLSAVHIIKPDHLLGQTTTANIQSGLYYSHLGAMREVVQRITTSIFQHQPPVVIGTGGFSYLFENEHIFDSICPELVLEGLQISAKLN